MCCWTVGWLLNFWRCLSSENPAGGRVRGRKNLIQAKIATYCIAIFDLVTSLVVVTSSIYVVQHDDLCQVVGLHRLCDHETISYFWYATVAMHSMRVLAIVSLLRGLCCENARHIRSYMIVQTLHVLWTVVTTVVITVYALPLVVLVPVLAVWTGQDIYFTRWVWQYYGILKLKRFDSISVSALTSMVTLPQLLREDGTCEMSGGRMRAYTF